MGTFGKFSPKNCFSLARAHHQKLVYNCVEGTFRTVLGLVCRKIIPTGVPLVCERVDPFPPAPPCHEVTFGTSYLTCSFAVSLQYVMSLGFGQGQWRSMWSYRVERGHSLV